MDIFVIDLVLDLLEAERLEFFKDLFPADIGVALVGQGAVIEIEVEEVLSLLHHGCVVLHDKLMSNCFNVHGLRIIIKSGVEGENKSIIEEEKQRVNHHNCIFLFGTVCCFCYVTSDKLLFL